MTWQHRNRPTGVGPGAESVLGILPTPSATTRTPAEDLIQRFLPPTPRTARQVEAGMQARAIREGLRAGTPEGLAAARAALNTGVLSEGQVRTAERGAKLTPFQGGFTRLTLAQALNVYDIATPEQRGEVIDLLARKADRVDKAAPRDQPALKRHIARARALLYVDPDTHRYVKPNISSPPVVPIHQ